MIPTPSEPPQRVEGTNLDTGRPLDAELLTEAQARELRRRQRRKQRTEQEHGLRILNAAMRQVSRGRLDKAGKTIAQGFGQMMVDQLLKKMKGG